MGPTTSRQSRRPTVRALIERATGGKKLDRNNLFRPSMAYRLLADPFGIWCDYHAPEDEAIDETGRYDEMRMQRGVEYEESWVHEHHPNATKIAARGLAGLRNTLEAMLAGVPAIHSPQLWSLGDDIYGQGDLLVRVNGRGSDLGPYHYRVKEIKHSRNLQDYHLVQAAAYNRALSRIQGFSPDTIAVVLRDSEERVSSADASASLDQTLSQWVKLRKGGAQPEPGGFDKTISPWRIYGNTWLQKRQDLTLLPDVGQSARDKIRRVLGAGSIPEITRFDLNHLQQAIGEKLGAMVYYASRAYKKGGPVVAPGRRLSIPRGKRNLYFDFETSDEVHPTQPPHVYLIGLWDKEADRFVYFLAHGAKEEERIFREFLDYVGDPRATKLYHWTGFEIGVMKEVAERYPKLASRLDRLFESCVDLKEAVKTAVYLPVPTYSIKKVAPALGFRWRQQDVGAFESMALYWDFLGNGDRTAVEKAIKYNEDDCVAMWHVDKVLTRQFG